MSEFRLTFQKNSSNLFYGILSGTIAFNPGFSMISYLQNNTT